MRRFAPILLLLAVGFSTASYCDAGASVSLAWDASAGSASYNVYLGSAVVTNVATNAVELHGLISCRTNCAVTALDSNGVESAPSNMLILGDLQTQTSTNLLTWNLATETAVDETSNGIQFFRQELQ